MSQQIDLQYRPTNYFRVEKLEKLLIQKVPGAVLRERLQQLYDQGRYADLRQEYRESCRSPVLRRALECLHPRYLGGNYLPTPETDEVEVARLRLKSTTYDVMSVYARPVLDGIQYRIVDEYEGETLLEPTAITTAEPMTLREFAEFFYKTTLLIPALEDNFGCDVVQALEFFRFESDFYPELDTLCRQWVVEQFPQPEPEDDGVDDE